MKLVKLLWADIFRDGGSYGAEFSTDEDANYSIFLERSRMPNGKGLHHRWLFKHRGSFPEHPENGISVVTGSIEEQEITNCLKCFLEASPKLTKENQDNSDNYHLERLEELLYYIPLRESCLANDVRASFSKRA